MADRERGIDFIFMLTRDDRTIADCLDVVGSIASLGLGHIGFKDVGVDLETMRRLNRAIKAAGATSYMEIVSLDGEACRGAARVALDVGVDRLLGGTEVEDVLEILRGRIAYYPFPGRPAGHPTRLAGTPRDVAADCVRFRGLGCAGVDLLAYRATDADPLSLVRAARRATDGSLIVAGSVDRPDRIKALAEAGADAFTIGSAAFDAIFSPQKKALSSQLREIMAIRDMAVNATTD